MGRSFFEKIPRHTLKMSCKLLVVIASLLAVASLDRNQVTGRVVEKLGSEGVVLFNFTDPAVDMSGWTEVSDTVREPGKSKALLVLQKTQVSNGPSSSLCSTPNRMGQLSPASATRSPFNCSRLRASPSSAGPRAATPISRSH